ncbi:MAG: protein TolQ [Alphaproteobacteria bacterium]|nr:protein TolQ [Alphaproteobacteria bacterium]
MDHSTLQAAATQLSVTGQNIVAPVVHGMSMWDLFWGASPVIKLVMMGLIIASIWSWTIILHKLYKVRQLNTAADQFEDAFWSGGALDDLYDRIQGRPQDPLSAVFCTAMKEWRRSISKGIIRTAERGTLEQRIDRVMQLTVSREMDLLERHMGFLASLGTSGVTIGLFGTVLGIIDSFEAIAGQHSASLAVVGPGMAEALFATAIGLVASIPAAIAYNKISTDLNRYANRLDAFTSEFGSIISRQLEEHA